MRKDMSSDWTTVTCRFKHNNNPSQKPSSLGINPPQPSTRPKWAFSMGEDAPFDPTSPDDLIARAKTLVATDLGILDGGRLLDDDFIWIGASNYGEVLSKADYLAAAKFFQLRTTFPDWDFRAHDYRLDVLDPLTVRFTARTVGNMRGQLRLRNNMLLPPNGKPMICPPEAISITFGPNGEVKKICSGFVMDRFVGNTGGVCGVMAAATIAGAPPSPFEIYPITTIIRRFFARPQRQLMETKSFLAPFPESVMIQLAKGVVASQMAALDPDLLSDDFTFCGPIMGPIDKTTFVDTYASTMFGGAEPELSHFRVDPYDPYRVWVDFRSYGQFEDGDIFETPPQAISFAFNDDGFCVRITGDAVMDPSIGNAGGLGGLEGINYAAGSPTLAIATRPLPEILNRIRRKAVEPFSKVGVDDYVLESKPQENITTPKEDPLASLFSALGYFTSLGGSTMTQARPLSPKQAQANKRAEAARKAAEAARLRAEVMMAERAEQEAARKAREFSERKARKVQEAAVIAATSGRKQSRLNTTPSVPWLLRIGPRDESLTSVSKVKKDQDVPRIKAKTAARKEETLKEVRISTSNREVEARKKLELAKRQVEAREKMEAIKFSATREAPARNRLELTKKVASAKRKHETKLKQDGSAEKKEKDGAKLVAAKEESARNRQELSIKQANAKREKEATTLTVAKEASARKRQELPIRPTVTKPSKMEMIGSKKQVFGNELKIKPVPPSKPPPPTAFGKVSQISLSRTIALPKEKGKIQRATPSSATIASPKGLPSLRRWKVNSDGSLIGLVSGSDQFDDNERITTSPIVKGNLAPGNVVRTRSGSKYFLT